jgi:multiple antibiotic resistance protein
MHPALSFGLTSFTSLFSIVDPLAAVPIFLALTSNDTLSRRREMALRAALTMLGVLIAFSLGGSVIFRFFGITMPAFKIAGGVLLFMVALDMLRAKASETKTSPSETEENLAKDDVGLIPIGIPLLSGPGAIASVTLLSEKASSWAQEMALLGAVAVLAIFTWFVLHFAGPVARIFGRTGLNLITRIMGLILAATAAQFIVDGVQTVLHLT